MGITDQTTVAEVCLRSSALFAKKTAFDIFSDGSLYAPVSYALFGRRVKQLAHLFADLGMRAGDRILLLSENRPEWPLAYFGIALSGAVSVPVLTGFSSDQIGNICAHSGVSACCVSGAFAHKVEERLTVPLIYIDTVRDERITVSINGEKRLFLLPNLDFRGQEFPKRSPDDLTSIVYTSGSLGHSKGVMLSNRNLVSCALAVRKFVRITPKDRLLSVLPLAHAYECALGLLNAVICGAKISYLDKAPAPSVLLSAAKTVRPTAIISVPLLIEKIYRGHIDNALKTNPLFRFAPTRPLAYRAAGKKLNKALGGKLRFFGIGGAPLSEDTEKFLRASRFPYSTGYGLTEASPMVAGTAPFRFPFRSSGSVLPGLDLRIMPVEGCSSKKTGEIQIRGPNVMLGYYNDEEKTREAFTEDGWLKTGDIGSVTKKRKLYVQGRLKALILSSSGENIYPEEIEGLLNTSDLVEDALVISGDNGELVAIVHISENAKALARSAITAFEKKLDELKNWTNNKLASFSRVSRIEPREEPFEKTPTFKIKRYLYNKISLTT